MGFATTPPPPVPATRGPINFPSERYALEWPYQRLLCPYFSPLVPVIGSMGTLFYITRSTAFAVICCSTGRLGIHCNTREKAMWGSAFRWPNDQLNWLTICRCRLGVKCEDHQAVIAPRVLKINSTGGQWIHPIQRAILINQRRFTGMWSSQSRTWHTAIHRMNLLRINSARDRF